MMNWRFIDSKGVAMLEEVEAGAPVGQILREHGISHAIRYNWKSESAGASVVERGHWRGKILRSDQRNASAMMH